MMVFLTPVGGVIVDFLRLSEYSTNSLYLLYEVEEEIHQDGMHLL